jgi:mitogen-activated protein kinase 15
MAEMIAGKPLYPGSSTINQLDRIMSTLPPPSKEDVQSINSPYAKAVLAQIVQRKHKTLIDVLPQADDVSLDLLSQLLQFNPEKRVTAEQCLEHAYLSKFHDCDKEPVIGCDIVPVIDDNKQLTVDEYRQQLYKDITIRRTELHPPTPKITDMCDSIVEDCETQCSSNRTITTPVCPGKSNKTTSSRTPPMNESAKDYKQKHIKVVYRSQSANVANTKSPDHRRECSHIRQYHSSINPFGNNVGHGKPPVSSNHGRPAVHAKSTLDLTVTSARMVPVTRPTNQWREVNRKLSRGGPSRFAAGSYTQTHGVIHQSDLMKIKQNNW